MAKGKPFSKTSAKKFNECRRHLCRKHQTRTFLGVSRDVVREALGKELGLDVPVSFDHFLEAAKDEISLYSKKTVPSRKRVLREAQGFYDSPDWQSIRSKIVKRYGNKCLSCGKKGSANTKIHVDHVFPRSLYPDLELNIFNCQTLCERCNKTKMNKNCNDYRPRDDEYRIELERLVTT